ncbi:MAG: NAD-dependent epimerase/dehydratase family protein [Pseudomonadota bacterium]
MPIDSLNPSSTYQPGVALDDVQLILDKTPAAVWSALCGQRIFITGGTGFVGCWLLEALLWANEQLQLGLSISVLSRSPKAFTAKAPHLANHPIVTLILGDVNDLGNIHELFDIVIHAATDVVKADADPVAILNNIIQGTRETLALTQRCNAKRYLLTSSGAVYGRQPSTLSHIPENYLGAPDTRDKNSAYGEGKRVSEWLTHCHARQYGLDAKIARCFALLGPYLPLDAQFAAGNFIRDGLDNKTISVNGDGTACRSYLYAADMAIWLLTILINGESGQNYNLGSDDSISIKDLAETVSTIIYGEKKITIASQPIENVPIQKYVPNIAKASHELHLFPYTDLPTAIRKTMSWEMNNRALANHPH